MNQILSREAVVTQSATFRHVSAKLTLREDTVEQLTRVAKKAIRHPVHCGIPFVISCGAPTWDKQLVALQGILWCEVGPAESDKGRKETFHLANPKLEMKGNQVAGIGDWVAKALRSNRPGIVGNVDAVEPTKVSGWIAYVSDGEIHGRRRIRLEVEGQVIAESVADRVRPDVLPQMATDQRFGYSLHLEKRSKEQWAGKSFLIIDEETGESLTSETLMLPTDSTVVVDIGDFVHYFAHHATPSGIQRVTIELVDRLRQSRVSRVQLVAARLDGKGLERVPWSWWSDLIEVISEGDNEGRVQQVAQDLRATVTDSRPFRLHLGDTLLILGAPWASHQYLTSYAQAQTSGANIVPLVYDLIPLTQPERFPAELRRIFERAMTWFAINADQILTISEFTKSEFIDFCARKSLEHPPIACIRLASEVKHVGLGSSDSQLKNRDQFVMFVSTIEARKGHAMAARVWLNLRGRLGAEQLPRLLFVGRMGWMASELMQILVDTDYVGGKVEIRSDVSDGELTELYREALFTIYPSTYEGWGLPVGESLALGTPVIASNAASIPEVGGAFVEYHDPGDQAGFEAKVLRWLEDPRRVEAQRAFISEFRPDTWDEVSERVESTLAESINRAAKHRAPRAHPGCEYVMGVNPLTVTSDNLMVLSWNLDVDCASPLLRQTWSATSEVVGQSILRRAPLAVDVDGAWFDLTSPIGLEFILDRSSRDLQAHLLVASVPDSGGVLVTIRCSGISVNRWVIGEELLSIPIPNDEAVRISLVGRPRLNMPLSHKGLAVKSLVLTQVADQAAQWGFLRREGRSRENFAADSQGAHSQINQNEIPKARVSTSANPKPNVRDDLAAD